MTPHNLEVPEGHSVCKRGHLFVRGKHCLECSRLSVKEWRQRPENRERLLAQRKKYNDSHKELINNLRNKWRSRNLETASWENMVQRCTNPKNKMYGNYGARGIQVCERWLGSEGLNNFRKDMGKKPSKEYTIERRNNDKGYSPDNCYWTTQDVQARNNRKTHIISHNGKTQCRADWAADLGINPHALASRFRMGWSVERALEEKLSDCKAAHKKLVEKAMTWLSGTMKCSVSLCDMASAAGEIPDAIGWQGCVSHLVECKMTRLDFFGETKKKTFRIHPETGVGMFRYYMVPDGLIAIEEVPENWGLLYAGKRIVKVKKATAFKTYNRVGEMKMMISALRRTQLRIDRPLHQWLRWDAEVTPIRPAEADD